MQLVGAVVVAEVVFVEVAGWCAAAAVVGAVTKRMIVVVFVVVFGWRATDVDAFLAVREEAIRR